MILEPSLPRVVKHQFNGQDAPITRVKFSPDGSYLATSSMYLVGSPLTQVQATLSIFGVYNALQRTHQP